MLPRHENISPVFDHQLMASNEVPFLCNFNRTQTLLHTGYYAPEFTLQWPPPTYSMMESSGGFLSFDSSFLHDWTPASWCWGSALITFCGTRGKRLHSDMFRVCVKHVTLCSGWSLVVSCLAWDYYKPYVSFTWNEVTLSSALLSAQTFAN